MEQTAKLRRLDALRRRLPHITASGISSFLKDIKANGIPDVSTSRVALWRAAQVATMEATPYGLLIVTLALMALDGSTIYVEAINPLAFMYIAFRDCPEYRNLIVERYLASQCTLADMWRLVLYGDEITPGNVLAHGNLRKCWALYWNMIEMGSDMLSNEYTWIPIVIVRSSIVKLVAGGISQIYGSAIKLFNVLSHTGLFLEHASIDVGIRIFAKLAGIVQDGGAHKSVWHCKGDAGTRFCMLCLNLLSLSTGVFRNDDDADSDDDLSGEMLSCSILHERDLHFATDEDIRGTVRRLDAFKPVTSAGDFKLREQAAGFRHEPYGLLMDATLDNVVRPASQYMHDPMHAIFVKGSFNIVVWLLLTALTNNGAPAVWSMIGEYLALWTWPGGVKGSTLGNAFSPNRAEASRKAKHLKCTASEGLSMYSLIAFFMSTVVAPTGLCPLALAAYFALADVIDLVIAIPRKLATADMLRTSIERFLDACVAAGWRCYMTPKFHWLVHLPRELSRFNVLITCWVHERKHRMVKRYAHDILNTKDFDCSLTRQVLLHQFHDLQDPGSLSRTVSLQHARPPSKTQLRSLRAMLSEPELAAESCSVSSHARLCCGATCMAGDVAYARSLDSRGFVACRIRAHAEVDGVVVTFVTIYPVATYDPRLGVAEWLLSAAAAPELVLTEDIYITCEWCEPRDGVVRTLVPSTLRGLPAMAT